MIKYVVVAFCLIPTFAYTLLAQEMIVPLDFNPAKATHEPLVKKKSGFISPLLLPFKEDFSYPGPYPDPKLWADKYVFVNPTFALNPKTIGTATFDALNQFGEIYGRAEENPFQFRADMLTSNPIRLDSVFSPAPVRLSPADSILLTFYYQPQGRGSGPRERDTLVLEFLHTPGHFVDDADNPENQIWVGDEWRHIWSVAGSSIKKFKELNAGNYFKRVAVKIEDPVYLRSDFRFRFRNYGSFPFTKTPSNFAGNTCIWNIDYITLDCGHNMADSFYYDIAFVQPAQSILRSYQSMPWAHYIINPQTHLKPSFNLTFANLDNQTHNYSYRYFIRDELGSIIRNYTGGTWNIAPFHLHGYQDYTPHTTPILIPNPLPTTTAMARLFRIYHVIRAGTTGDDLNRNDTIVFNQVFDNYFAYDDGIPEAGFGLVGVNPRGAMRFNLSRTDTLTAVKFYFNPTLNNRNIRSFYLIVWKNLAPEEILYTSGVLTTEFNPGSVEFVTYELDQPLVVSDTIFVGWRQTTNDFLNMGFDLNNNARDNLFFNTHGTWMGSIIDGALMIRPVFGDAVFTNVQEQNIPDTPVVFPNPARNDKVNLAFPNVFGTQYSVEVFDTAGKLVFSGQNNTEIEISGLQNGLYLLRAQSATGGKTITTKFLIAR